MASVNDSLIVRFAEKLTAKHFADSDWHEHVRCKIRKLGRLVPVSTVSTLSRALQSLLNELPVIQNAAVRVVTGAGKFNHITPVLRELHWLPVRQRIRFKLAMIVYKCLHGLAPPYLADDCVLVSSVASRRHLRSADTRKLVVQRTRTVIGARDFVVSCAVVLNLLHTDL